MALNQAQLVNPPVGTRPGGVKAGTGITITADGTISASGGGGGSAGQGLDGSSPSSVLKVSITQAAAPPAISTLTAVGAIDGSLYWDNNLGELYIRYNDGVSSQWVQANAGTFNIASLPPLP
jgi:hypothetical protein